MIKHDIENDRVVLDFTDYISAARRLVDNKLANQMTIAQLDMYEYICEVVTTNFGDDELINDLKTTSGNTQKSEENTVAAVHLALTECGFTEVPKHKIPSKKVPTYKLPSKKTGEDLKQYIDRVLEPDQFVQASSQSPYDFRMKLRNGEVLLAEVKKTDKDKIMLNDTLPYADAAYIIFQTETKEIKCTTGQELIRMEVGSDEYEDVVHYQAMNLCQRDVFKNLNPYLTSCNRMNFTVSIKTLA